MLIAFLALICFHLSVHHCFIPDSVKLGALVAFGDEEELRLVLQHAVWLNRDFNPSIRVSLEIETFQPFDSLSTSQAACKLIESGVWAIINPYSELDSWIVKSIADRYEIPHLLTSWEHPYARKFFNSNGGHFNYSLNLYPGTETLNKAIYDYIMYNKDWRSFSVVYDNREGLIRIKDVYTVPINFNGSHNIQLKIRKFNFHNDLDSEIMFKDMVKSRDSNFIISFENRENFNKVMEKFKKFRMVDLYLSYFINDFDIQSINLTDHNLWLAFNVTGFRMFDPDDQNIKSTYNHQFWRTGRNESNYDFKLNHRVAFLYDAVTLYFWSLNSLSTRSIKLFPPEVSCRTNTSWSYGKYLIDQMRNPKIKSNFITGPLSFDQFGNRKDVQFELIRYIQSHWTHIGGWDSDRGIHLDSGEKAEELSAMEYLRTTKLKLIVVESKPYVLKKENYSAYSEDHSEFDKYEGFCIDMLKIIKDNLNISGYELIIYRGKSYGKIDPNNGSWTGMLGEMLEKNYDLATTDLTITAERQRGVDFTIPFLTLGISILHTKPQPAPLNLWAFLDPFSLEVWFYVATAYIGVTLLMYYIARISPYEWLNSHPCDEEPSELTNQFSLGNCMWFTLGSIMQQGSDLAPKALSMRFLASSWSFFTLIMVSSYTANLAAFLTVARMENPINNAEDLAAQTKVAYGCSRDGSTRLFFRDSNYSTYQRMYAFMESAEPPVYSEGNEDGVRRVLKGNYAFLMESLSILYNVNRYCNLTQKGDQLDQKGYGIAMRPNSPYRTIFSNQIIKLQEEGKIGLLKKKWFEEYPKDRRAKETPSEADCPPSVETSTSALDVISLGGVFIVLFIGITISALFVIVEFWWRAKKICRDERENICVMMVKELWNIFKGQSTSRRYWSKRSSDATRSLSNDTTRFNKFPENSRNNINRKFTNSQSIDGSKVIAN